MSTELRFPLETPILVAGAGGFIGGHVVSSLGRQGFQHIVAVDLKPRSAWFQHTKGVAEREADLRDADTCRSLVIPGQVVINLAADMGGMGYIEANKLACMLNVLVNTHLLSAAAAAGVGCYFFASSACVYPANLQTAAVPRPLRESDAYPAMPEDGYGWEKLFSERMCRHFRDETGLSIRVSRFHNVYGPHGTFIGGREKAPAAICRKVAAAALSGRHEIFIWGDGSQTRSFLYVDDAVAGVLGLLNGCVTEPVNIGSERVVTINELVTLIESIAGIRLERHYLPDSPQGVRGRTSDNTFVEASIAWRPAVTLEDGLARTYQWVYNRVRSGPIDPGTG